MHNLDRIYQIVKDNPQRIALPESSDPRVLSAAVQLQTKGLVAPVLLGNPSTIQQAADAHQIEIDSIEICDIKARPQMDIFKQTLSEVYSCKNKTVGVEQISVQANNPLFASALMLKCGLVDGVVAGAATTTSDVLRAAFNVLGTQAGIKTISGAFIMTSPDGRIFLFADCAVVVEPTAEQLADIAIASSQTCKNLLNIDPKVAMLSFSTLGSTKHSLADKVAEATALVHKKAPNLAVCGEVQLDSAINPKVASSKAPNDPVAGQANVLVFPSLEAGNIGYKLVQQLARMEAIGPVLQGIGMPMNDLSRGTSVDDIINLCAITAVQAYSCQKIDHKGVVE